MLELLELILGGFNNTHTTDKKGKIGKKEKSGKKGKKEKKENKHNKKTVFNDKNFRAHSKYKDIYDTDSDSDIESVISSRSDCHYEGHHYEHDNDSHCHDNDSHCHNEHIHIDAHHRHHNCDIVKHDNSHNRNKIIQKLSDVIQHVDGKITSKTLQSNIDDYFIRDCSNGILTPKFIQMNVNDTIINVPIYTLVNHTNINIKEFKCKFKTDAYNLGVNCNKNFDIETELTFTRDGDIDGYARINEILLKENF